ncbi:3-hydroxyisobutyrate dehydrogenase [Pseudomonas flavescens]|uniref:3-hydroxyisobutyrate dehydrogenase n=1 Tax=Phytopseudomonas flavescens TaxID=29435 RepID=A0A1G8MYY8_9GAMM|nr:NAD(P)-dependent oxidoreductase [Pseudomonas flavescens]SDI73027.1 3-hydroxyisobutyrate dehydrogenase [Pseudomonas flavescens]
MKLHVGVIGLGNMGGNMAITLAAKGLSVLGLDPSAAARERASASGVGIATDLTDLARRSDVIVLSLPKAEHVEAVCFGADGLVAAVRPGTVIVDTTTSTPATSQAVAAAFVAAGAQFLDAPVSGGPAGAAAGTMTMVIGGEAEALASALPVLEAMSATRVHVGGVGAGNIAKIANNLLAAAHLITTAEAVTLAARAGVAPEKLIEGINAGSGRSAASQGMFPTWVLNKAYDSGFSMGLMRKDVGLAHDLIAQLGLDLPLAAATARAWAESAATLADGEDFCCIARRTSEQLFGKGQ